MTDGKKLKENAAAIGLELAGRERDYEEFYATQRDGWLDVTRFVVRAAEDFTLAEGQVVFEYDWIVAIETFVDALLKLSGQRLLAQTNILAIATESIAAAES